MAKPNPNPPQLTPQDIERFWSKVNKAPGQGATGECWEWQLSCCNKGYGKFNIVGRILKAHRVSYFLHYKEWPFNLLICHHCDNPPCCNPDHLFKGTNDENMADMMKKNRHASLTGTTNPAAKITESDVMEIRRRYDAGEFAPLKWADEFNVTNATIGQIIRNQSWRHLPHTKFQAGTSHLPKNGSKLSERDVQEIRRLANTYSRSALANMFKVCAGTIRLILAGKTWVHS